MQFLQMLMRIFILNTTKVGNTWIKLDFNSKATSKFGYSMQSGYSFTSSATNSLKVLSLLAIVSSIQESLDGSTKSSAKFNLGDEDEVVVWHAI